MFSATRIASSGSSHACPVRRAASTPSSTPTLVTTSLKMCRPSASSAGERSARPCRSSTDAHTAFSRPAPRFTPSPASPSPACSGKVAGFSSAGSASRTIAAAASTISTPSATALKYSAFVCPYGWLASAGRAATRSAISAATAAATLMMLSSASEYSATLPVIRYATYFRASTTTATRMLPSANLEARDEVCTEVEEAVTRGA